MGKKFANGGKRGEELTLLRGRLLEGNIFGMDPFWTKGKSKEGVTTWTDLTIGQTWLEIWSNKGINFAI